MRTARKRRLATRLVPLAVFALIAGCSDESEPSTWLKRLADPKKRPEAVKHLAMIYDDDLAKANRNREDPSVKAIADAIVEPLTDRYMSGDLDDDSRSA